MGIVFGVIGLIIWIAIAFWPARVARRKGHSFIGYFMLEPGLLPLGDHPRLRRGRPHASARSGKNPDHLLRNSGTTTMAKTFKGKIALDIRDSEPDWEPYLAPKAAEGAPNVLVPRLGRPGLRHHGHVRRSGRVPEHGAHRRAGREVLQLPHHGAVLADPRVAAHRPQRHDQRHGDHRRVRVRVPGHLDPDPVRVRVHLRGARRARATTPTASASGTSPPARSATSPPTRAVGRSAAASSASTASSAARPTRGIPTSSTTTIRSSRPARPEDGYHLAEDLADKAIEFIRDAKVIDPDKPFFMYLAPQAGHAPHHVPLGVGRQVQGRVRRGLRGDPRRHPRAPEGAGAPARGHRAVADQPARRARAHRPRRSALAPARHRPPVGHADRRREAPVHAHGRGVRRLRLATPTTSSAASSTSSRSPASSTTRSSW